nr:hypothetical protein [Tanacetum cinerariifolium]
MRTRFSSNIPSESSPNPTSSNPKRHNRRRSKKPFILEESPVDTMVDQRTMVEFLCAATEGYAEAIMVPLILAEQFELKGNPSLAQKEPPPSIHTWEDLVSKFINEFFPPQERQISDVLTIIENKSKVRNSRNKSIVSQVKSSYANSSSSSEIAKLTHTVNQQTSYVTTAMTAILKQFQATPPPASVNSVEEICVTFGGAHPNYQCLAADGNTFLELQNNIQGYVSAAVNMMARFFQMNTASTLGSGPLLSNTSANPKGELKAITTRSGLVLDGHFVPMPPPFINPEEDERVEETLTDPKLDEFTIKVPPPLVQKHKPYFQRNYVVHQRDPLHPNIPYPSRMSKQNTTSSSPDHLLEEFPDAFALIIFPLGNDDLSFDIESDLREIKYLLNHDFIKEMDSILEDSIDECNLTNPNVNLFNTIPEMVTDEHALDYSSPPLYDEYDVGLVEIESDTIDVYNDPFDSKGEKIKESKLLIDKLVLPR